MKVIFFGTPTFAVPSLQRLLDAPDINVLGVVTQPDKRRGRGNKLSPSPVKALALEHQRPIWQPARIKKSPDVLAELDSYKADAFVVVAYGQILSQQILDMPRLGCINGHGSLLPKYRGAAPIQWCLYHGETETGMTSMLMDAGMDTGAMLLKAATPISPLEHAHDLATRLAEISATLLIETLQKLDAGTVKPDPQENDQATYAPLIKKEDYALDWSKSAIALHNQVRGFYPSCFTKLGDKALKITETVPLEAPYRQALPADIAMALQTQLASFAGEGEIDPGKVVAIWKNLGPIVQTGAGLLWLKAVQLAGKRSQSGWDFANGNHIAVGDVLGE